MSSLIGYGVTPDYLETINMESVDPSYLESTMYSVQRTPRLNINPSDHTQPDVIYESFKVSNAMTPWINSRSFHGQVPRGKLSPREHGVFMEHVVVRRRSLTPSFESLAGTYGYSSRRIHTYTPDHQTLPVSHHVPRFYIFRLG